MFNDFPPAGGPHHDHHQHGRRRQRRSRAAVARLSAEPLDVGTGRASPRGRPHRRLKARLSLDTSRRAVARSSDLHVDGHDADSQRAEPEPTGAGGVVPRLAIQVVSGSSAGMGDGMSAASWRAVALRPSEGLMPIATSGPGRSPSRGCDQNRSTESVVVKMFEDFRRQRVRTEIVVNTVIGGAGAPVAWLPAEPGDVGARRAAARQRVHRGVHRPSRVRRLGEARPG